MRLFYILLSIVTPLDLSIDSTTISGSKLYSIYEDYRDDYIKVVAYELKDGLTSDIFSRGESYNLNKIVRGFKLKFFDAPENLNGEHDKLWLKADQKFYDREINYSSSNTNSNWMGYICLSDMVLNPNNSLIKFPTTDKFPLLGYTTNLITNEYGSALYTIGGAIYSKKEDTLISSNSFFKYNYTTLEWTDMTSSYGRSLDPIHSHKSVVIDNRYLVLLGGNVSRDPTSNSSLVIDNYSLFKTNSIYKLWTFDTFTKVWENVAINTSIIGGLAPNLNLSVLSVASYSNTIYALAGDVREDGSIDTETSQFLGTLDFKYKTWSWIPIPKQDVGLFNSNIKAIDLPIFNNRLIIPKGITENGAMRAQIYDISSLKVQPSSSSSNNTDAANQGSTNSNTSKSNNNVSYTGNSDTVSSSPEASKTMDKSEPLPSYAISLIAVGSIISVSSVLFIIYLKSKRNKHGSFNSRRIARMPTVWSYPKEANISKTIIGYRKQRPNTNTAHYSILKFNSIKTRKTDSGGSASIKFES